MMFAEKKYTKTCQRCGKEFTAKNPRALYCGEKLGFALMTGCKEIVRIEQNKKKV